jgi:hypothetical protein
MFNGMKLTIDTAYVSKLTIHPASQTAFTGFMEIFWEFIDSLRIDGSMDANNPFIVARPLVITDMERNDTIIMHFEMYEHLLQQLEWQELEHYNSESELEEDFQEKQYTVLRVESELSDVQIELISWLYVIDIFDDLHYTDALLSWFMHYLDELSHELLVNILKHRPDSDFVEMWLAEMVREEEDCLK